MPVFPPLQYPLAHWRVVMVSPLTPENVGAAARVMANFGCGELVLVAPRCVVHPDGKASHLAREYGREILEQRREVDTLRQALADVHYSVCLAMQDTEQPRADFTGIVPEGLPARVRPPHRGALVFGREDNGLTNEEIALCAARWSLPVSPDAPSLNVAQAIAVALAGLQEAKRRAAGSGSSGESESATQGEVEGLLEHLAQVLHAADFERGVPMQHPLAAMRTAALRAGLSPAEVRVLRGACRRILNAIKGPTPRP